jgi:hypothetical protein
VTEPTFWAKLPANDPNSLYAGGVVGLLVASQGSVTIPGDATFDNFVVTALEPRLSIEHSGSTVKVSWPVLASYKLQSSPSLSLPVWTDVSSGITQVFGMDVCTISGATDTKFYRLSCSCQ